MGSEDTKTIRNALLMQGQPSRVALAALERVEREGDELRGEVLGLQRMLEEALKPGFHASACPWCARPLTARGVTLHLPFCRKRPSGMGHA